MKKRYLILTLLTLIALALPLAASAASSGTCGDNLTWTLTDSGVLTISGTGEMDEYYWQEGDYEEPEDHLPSWKKNKVKKIVIKQGVTSVGSGAFSDCTNLTSVTIPSSVTRIGGSYVIGGIFRDCYAGAFEGCTSLTSVTIPASVTNIGNGAFYMCTSLNSIQVSTSNPNYTDVDGVLYNKAVTEMIMCPPAKNTVSIPKGVTSISSSAFSGCSSLTSVAIPNTVTSISSSAFSGCSSLTSVTIPNSVTSIEDWAFGYCSGLTNVTIPSSVTCIGIGAFTRCSSLMSVTVPNSVTSLGIWVFDGCSSNLTISCYSGSAVHDYAIEEGIKVKLLDSKPTITTQPASKTVNAGEKVTFKVAAAGATSYQWYYRSSSVGTWKKLSGSKAATPSFSFTAKATHNGYQYRCLVKNSAGSVYTSIASVGVKPVITTQPKDATVNAGQTATFKVAASGADSYQWYYRSSASGSWKKSSGSKAATSSFSFTAKATHNGYQYRCLVKNSAGSAYSSIVSVAVKPVITAQPKNATVKAGGTVTFTVTASGADSYQWYYRNSATGSWKKSSGSKAATPSFSFTAKATHNGYQYRCLVKNSAGSVYSSIVTVAVKPVITAQPKNATVKAGGTVTFTVTASGADSYQWYYRNSASGSWKKSSSSGAATPSFSFTAKATHNGYQYRCLVKNSAGGVYTNTVTITAK